MDRSAPVRIVARLPAPPRQGRAAVSSCQVSPPWRRSGPKRSRFPAPFGAVIGIADASAADATHGGQALLKAGVVAGRCAGRFGVDRTPRIIVRRLSEAVVGCDERGDAAKYQ